MARDGRLTPCLPRCRASGRHSAVLERSRSGDGGHVWAFFIERVPASSARRIGAYLLREAMTARAEIDLVSYDRLFPAQDFLPRQGFGNLIALPLQGECRTRGRPYSSTHRRWTLPGPMGVLGVCRPPESRGRARARRVLGDVPVGPDARTYRRPTRAPGSPPPPASYGRWLPRCWRWTASGCHRPF